MRRDRRSPTRRVFPEGGVAWELNYRGDLVFLDQARRQQAARAASQVEDGWTYFLHGWTQVIAEVFHLEFPTSGPGFDRHRADRGQASGPLPPHARLAAQSLDRWADPDNRGPRSPHRSLEAAVVPAARLATAALITKGRKAPSRLPIVLRAPRSLGLLSAPAPSRRTSRSRA